MFTDRKRWQLVFSHPVVRALLFLTSLYGLLWLAADLRRESIPDFASIASVAERKAAFEAFMGPRIEEAWRRIDQDREQFQALQGQIRESGDLSRREQRALRKLAEKYYVRSHLTAGDMETLWSELEQRIQPVPYPLTMAQAVLESGWGTSRLARQGNNLFGTRCFSPGCGIPSRWGSLGATRYFQTYRTVQDSIDTYMRNLNRHRAYAEFRRSRQEFLASGDPPDSIRLAATLIHYAEERGAYIRQLQQILRDNPQWISSSSVTQNPTDHSSTATKEPNAFAL